MEKHNYYTLLLKAFPLIYFLFWYVSPNVKNRVKPIPYFPTILFVVTYAFLMGLSPLDFGTDKPGNIYIYQHLETYQHDGFKDPGWLFLCSIEKFLFGNDVTIFFLFTSIIYCTFYLLSAKNVFSKYYLSYFIVMAFGSLGFFQYGVNTIRAGLAISFLLYGISVNNKYSRLLFFLAALFIQKYSILLVLPYYICKYINKGYIFELSWIFCLIVSYIDVFALADYATILSLSDERTLSYLDGGDKGYDVGFRIDFILYSAFPLIFAFYLIKFKKVKDDFYSLIYRIYLMSNMIWLLIIRMPYTDRVAYYSWCLTPLLIIYPLVKYSGIFKQQQFVLNILIIMYICVNFAF